MLQSKYDNLTRMRFFLSAKEQGWQLRTTKEKYTISNGEKEFYSSADHPADRESTLMKLLAFHLQGEKETIEEFHAVLSGEV